MRVRSSLRSSNERHEGRPRCPEAEIVAAALGGVGVHRALFRARRARAGGKRAADARSGAGRDRRARRPIRHRWAARESSPSRVRLSVHAAPVVRTSTALRSVPRTAARAARRARAAPRVTRARTPAKPQGCRALGAARRTGRAAKRGRSRPRRARTRHDDVRGARAVRGDPRQRLVPRSARRGAEEPAVRARVLALHRVRALVVVPWRSSPAADHLGSASPVRAGSGGWYVSDVQVTWIIDVHGETINSVTGWRELVPSPAEGAQPRAQLFRVDDRRCCLDLDCGDQASTRAIRRSAESAWRGAQIRQVGTTSRLRLAANVNDAVSGGPSQRVPGGLLRSGQRLGSGMITCRDNAGEQRRRPVPSFKYDNTAPSMTGGELRPELPTRTAGTTTGRRQLHGDRQSLRCRGLLAGDVWRARRGAGGRSGNCTDVAGNPSTGGATIKYDAPGPSVGGSPDRGPDANGWYAEPVNVSFGGSEMTSGIAGCSGGGTYSGPDGMGSATGWCTDNAGNTGSGQCRDPVRRDRAEGQGCGHADVRPMRRAGSTMRSRYVHR